MKHHIFIVSYLLLNLIYTLYYMNLKKQSFLIILIGFFIQSFGQVGIFQTQKKWKQLKTKSFDIITPSNQVFISYKIMNDLYEYQTSDSLLGIYKDKRTYVIYGDHAISNGFVGPGPYRSGLYLTPPQNNFIGPGSWVKNLVNHENHHFVQHADARKGLVKYSYKLLGDFADSFLANVYLIGWYWEGDAVFRESYGNTYGRGNYSHFLNRNRLFAKQNLPYNTNRFTYAYNRPYNKYIPNHYNLGYAMVNYLHHSNPGALYSSVDKTVGQLRRLPGQLKRKTGKSLFQNFELALDSIADTDAKMDYLKPKSLLESTISYLHQSSVTKTDKNNSYYIEHSFLKPAKVYKDNKSLFTLGSSPDGVHRIQNNTNFIVWNELRTNPRFSSQSYSDLMAWNISGRKKIQLTKNRKAYSPTIHPLKNQVSYLELNNSYTFTIKQFDLSSGNSSVLLKTKSDYLRNLNYSEDGAFLTYIDQKTDRQILCVFNLETRDLKEYELPQLNQISNAFLTQDYTFVLTADYNSYEYIFLYNPLANRLKRSVQVASAYKHIQVKNQIMTFDFQTINGLRIGELDLGKISYTNLSLPRTKVVHQPSNTDTLHIDEHVYKDGIPHLRFHSVVPFLSTQDIQVDLYANDYLRKNNFLYRFYKNFGSENSVHQALYTYAHYPVHLSGIFTHSSSGTRNMHMGDSFITSFQENKYAFQLSYPLTVLKSGYTLQNTPIMQWAYRGLDNNTVETNYGSKHSNIEAKNTFTFAKNRGSAALGLPLYATLTNRFASNFKEAYITENSLRFGFNIFKHEHFLEAEIGLITEKTGPNTYRYAHEVIQPSTGYFLTVSSLGWTDPSRGVFLSDYSTHIKIKMKNTLVYPNRRITDFVFLKRVHIEPFVEQSYYRFRDTGNQKLTSYGSHIVFDIQWVKTLPVQLRLTYAKTPDLRNNSSFIGFGLVF